MVRVGKGGGATRGPEGHTGGAGGDEDAVGVEGKDAVGRCVVLHEAAAEGREPRGRSVAPGAWLGLAEWEEGGRGARAHVARRRCRRDNVGCGGGGRQ